MAWEYNKDVAEKKKIASIINLISSFYLYIIIKGLLKSPLIKLLILNCLVGEYNNTKKKRLFKIKEGDFFNLYFLKKQKSDYMKFN